MFHIFLILFLTFITIYAESVDRRFICPNNGVPKKNFENGKLIQCLPGWTATTICGPNYSCFFSGYNYQCCPSVEDEQNGSDKIEECPRDSSAILDSNGIQLNCGKKGECSMDGSFCHNGKICCEQFKLMIEEIKVPFPGSDHGEKRKNEIVIDPSVDVDTDIVREKEEVLESPTQPPTKEYPPLTTTRDDNISVTTKFADNEENLSKEDGNKIVAKNDSKDSKPDRHLNEYAPSRTLEQPNQNGIEDGEAAKRFLLEQIKRGWPYNEKYYRPSDNETEDIVVMRNRGHPEAIVHFPNST